LTLKREGMSMVIKIGAQERVSVRRVEKAVEQKVGLLMVWSTTASEK